MDRVLHGGDVYRHKDVIDFSANLNPLGMPPAARQALIEYVDEFSHYPDPDCVALTEAIAAFEGVDTDKVVVTAGATDAFERIAQVLKPRRALVVAPSYAGYEEALRHVGTHVVRRKLSSREGFRLTDKILAEMDGTDGTLKVSLFDVSDPTAPREAANYIVGGDYDWVSSSALDDHKAVCWDEKTQRVMIGYMPEHLATATQST